MCKSRSFHAVFLVRFVFLLFLVCFYPHSVMAQTCPPFPINVSNETGLNNAIGCYNSASAGSYEINITQSINLTATTTALNNSAGAQLQINANANFIDGVASYRIFSVSAGNITFDNITLQNGLADTAVCNGSLCGGAVLIGQGATVTVNSSSFNGNSAQTGGGGAILNQGTLLVNNSTFNANSARYGGAIYNFTSQASITASNSTFSGNSAPGNLGAGGALFHDEGTMMLYNLTVTGNSAGRYGAGIYSNRGTVSLNNSIVALNNGSNDCGATSTNGNFNVVSSLDSDGSCGSSTTSATINLGVLQDNGGSTQSHALLAGSAAIDAGDNAICAVAPVNNLDQRGVVRPQNSNCDIGAFEACSSLPSSVASELQLNSVIKCYNTAAAGTHEINVTQDITLTAATTAVNNTQGALLNINGNSNFIDGVSSYQLLNITAGKVTIDNTILKNGSSIIGGALYVASGADATVTNSSIMGSNSKSGGGIRNDGTLEVKNSLFSGNTTTRSGEGGGLSNYGTAHIADSTLTDNTAAFGAALYTRGTLTVSNTTVSGNPATSLAGGIYIFWSGNVTTYNITLSNNSAKVGGGILNNGGSMTMHNSIIANTTNGSNCYGTISGTNSLSDDGSCGGALVQSSNINLETLADNGCTTRHASSGLSCVQTHALGKGSDALDAGDNVICSATPVNNLDQLGIMRPQNNTCDIGAVEKVVDDSMFFPVSNANGGMSMIHL